MDAEDFFNEALGFQELLFVDESGNEIHPKFQPNGKQLKIKLAKPKEDFGEFQNEREKAERVVELAINLKLNFVLVFTYRDESEVMTDLHWSCDFGPAQGIGMVEIAKTRFLK